MADEVMATAAGKSAKNKFLGLLPEILPFIALAGAGLAFIFSFLIGVSSSGEGGASYFIYHFFDGEYINSIKALAGAWQGANRAVWLAGMLVTIFGLIAVIAFTALTVYKAISKYVFKKDCGVEFFAVLTFIAYAIFSSLFYAVNCAYVSVGGATVSTTYNAATICGLTLTSVVFGAYYALKALSNREYFNNKANLVKFLYTTLRIVIIIVLLGLISAPIIKVSTTNGTTVKSNFMGLLISGTAEGNADKLSSLTTTSVAGILLVAAMSVLCAALLVDNLSVLFSNKKNDIVFYVIGFAVTVLIMIIAAVAGGFYSDILASFASKNAALSGTEQIQYIRTGGGFNILVAVVDNEVVVRELELIKISAAIPIVVSVLGLLTIILTAAYPAILSSVEKAIEKSTVSQVAEGKAFLEVDGLCQYFVVGRDFFGRPTRYLKAVDNVSFKLDKGQTLGIVGESGCGKTTMGRTILRLYDVTKGEVWFKGEKISSLKNSDFNKLRPNMQMIFQDPYASLSPRLTVGEIIGEAVKQHKLVSKSEYHDYVLSVMKMCGLQPHYFERYPHEFSGGQRQRICIARALALKPELVICDEPVSALDVSIQAQIINMLIELRKSLGLTYIFISHDLSVVKHISDMVGVMYLGSMVEYGSRDNIFENTLHPYTKALFSAVPVPDPHVKMNRIILKGDIPSPVNPPSGCKFHTRCESCMEICGRITPPFKEVEKGHFCACHLYNTPEEVEILEENYREELRLAELEKVEQKKNVLDKIKDGVKSVFNKRKNARAEVTEDNAEADDVPKE